MHLNKLFIFIFFILTSCYSNPHRASLKEAKMLMHQKNYQKAANILKVSFRNSTVLVEKLETAHALAHLFDKYLGEKRVQALPYYNFIFHQSSSHSQKIQARKQMARIQYTAKDFKNAILSTSQIINFLPSQESFEFFILLSRSYLETKNLLQAEAEITTLLQKKLSLKQQVRAKILFAQIKAFRKQEKIAQKTYIDLMEHHPVLAQQYGAGLLLAAHFEEKNNIRQALKTLERHADLNDHQVQKRIQRLKQKEKNMPGFKGLSK